MALVQQQQDGSPTADANPVPVSTAPSNQNLPMRKRKQEAGNIESCANIVNSEKKFKASEDSAMSAASTQIEAKIEPTAATATSSGRKPRPPMSKAREIRLEQNRKAARESRRRKKIMVEELQRSVVFFSRTNATLKQQNEELERILLQAQSQIRAYESGRANQSQGKSDSTGTAAQEPSNAAPEANSKGTESSAEQTKESRDSEAQQAIASAQTQQAQKLPSMTQETQAHHAAQAAATQAMFETQGFPPAAARAAAQTFVAAPNAPVTVSKDSEASGNTTSNQPKFVNTPTTANIALGPNTFPFFLTMAPGTMPSLGNPQQQGAPVGTATAQAPTTGKTDFNQFFAMQMQPYLTTVLGANGSISMPIMQFAAMNKGNLVNNAIISNNQNTPPSTSMPSNANEVKEQN